MTGWGRQLPALVVGFFGDRIGIETALPEFALDATHPANRHLVEPAPAEVVAQPAVPLDQPHVPQWWSGP